MRAASLERGWPIEILALFEKKHTAAGERLAKAQQKLARKDA
jgi:hypothetical protein